MIKTVTQMKSSNNKLILKTKKIVLFIKFISKETWSEKIVGQAARKANFINKIYLKFLNINISINNLKKSICIVKKVMKEVQRPKL